jgi:C-terminal processing protease CtpA/Prc
VDVAFQRAGEAQPRTVTMERRNVLLRDVPLGLLLGDPADRVGYVKLRGFSASASQVPT